MAGRRSPGEPAVDLDMRGGGRFTPQTMYAAAAAYYVEDVTQADIAARLGVSRPTVSRLLAEARRQGIVEITVHKPESEGDQALSKQLAVALGIDVVYLVPAVVGRSVGPWLAPGVVRALADAGLAPGDVLLVSSGLTLYQCVHEELTTLAGVVVAPTVGGQEEPEPWYQTNAITTLLAERIGGRPSYLYAPALPSPALFASLVGDPSFQRIQELWGRASCALLGVGAAPDSRTVIPSFVPQGAPTLVRAAGDICSRFYDAEGDEVEYEGSDRLVALSVEALRRIPASIAVAVGKEKVTSIIAGARGGFFNRLVTDMPTASAVLADARRALSRP